MEIHSVATSSICRSWARTPCATKFGFGATITRASVPTSAQFENAQTTLTFASLAKIVFKTSVAGCVSVPVSKRRIVYPFKKKQKIWHVGSKQDVQLVEFYDTVSKTMWKRMCKSKKGCFCFFKKMSSTVSTDGRVKPIIQVDACKGCPRREEMPDPTQPTSRIVGGMPVTDPDKYPFFAALFYFDGVDFFWSGCGGSYVGEFQGRNFVVTAAHCLQYVNGNRIITTGFRPTHVAIKPPPDWPTNGLSTSQLFAINSTHCKYGYDPTQVTSENDLAVFEIASVAIDGVTNINTSNAIALATTSPVEGTPVVAIGNGTTNPNISELVDLMEVTVQVFSNATANQAYGGLVQPSMIAAGETAGGKDACSGDSGGPLLWFDGGVWKLLGVTSWGAGCGLAGFPGVYTRIPSFIAFLNDLMNPSVFSAFAAGIDAFTSSDLTTDPGYDQTRFFTGSGFAISRPTNTQRVVTLGAGASANLFAGNLNITVPATGDGVTVLIEGNSPLNPVADFSGFPTGLGLQTSPADWTTRFAATVTIVSGGVTYTATNQTTNPVPWTAFSPAFTTPALRNSVTSITVRLSAGNGSTTDVFGIGADPHVLCMDGTRLDIYTPGVYRYFDNGHGLIANLEVRAVDDGANDYAHALWVTEDGGEDGGKTFTFEGTIFASKVDGEHERFVHTVEDPTTGARLGFTMEGAYNTVGIRSENMPLVVRAGGLVAGMVQRVASLTSCEAVATAHVPTFLKRVRSHALVCGSGNPHIVSFHGASVATASSTEEEVDTEATLIAFGDQVGNDWVRATGVFAHGRLIELRVAEAVRTGSQDKLQTEFTAIWARERVMRQNNSTVHVSGRALHGVERDVCCSDGIAEASIGPLFVRVQPGGIASFALTNAKEHLQNATGLLSTPLAVVHSAHGDAGMYAEMMEPHLIAAGTQ